MILGVNVLIFQSSIVECLLRGRNWIFPYNWHEFYDTSPLFPSNLVTLGLPRGQTDETWERGCIGQKSTFKLKPPFIWYVAPREWAIDTW